MIATYPIRLVREREYDARAGEFIQKRADMATAKLHAQQARLDALLTAGVQAGRLRDKWKAMDAITDMVGRAVGPHAACRAGCDTCCHVPVPIARADAERIAQHTGRALAEPPALVAEPDTPQHMWTRCPFLKQNRCAIYAVRPLVCRIHFNMDSTPMLCAPAADGLPVRVPYWNRTGIERAAFKIFGVDMITRRGDIRDWFPATKGEAK